MGQEFDEEEGDGANENEFGGSEGGEESGFEGPQPPPQDAFDSSFAASNQNLVHMLQRKKK